jgi:acyl-CoA hydrolase
MADDNPQEKRTVTRTQTEMTQVVLPQWANALGNVFGGQVMAWIDICAAVAAQRHCRAQVVTASVDAVHFIEPIKQGDVVVLRSQVNATFHTSMECGVLVESENPLTGERRRAMKAYTTFVALDRGGRPQEVPPIELESEEDERRSADALRRREARLKMRAETKKRIENKA